MMPVPLGTHSHFESYFPDEPGSCVITFFICQQEKTFQDNGSRFMSSVELVAVPVTQPLAGVPAAKSEISGPNF